MHRYFQIVGAISVSRLEKVFSKIPSEFIRIGDGLMRRLVMHCIEHREMNVATVMRDGQISSGPAYKKAVVAFKERHILSLNVLENPCTSIFSLKLLLP